LVLFLQEQEKYEEEPFAKFQFIERCAVTNREGPME